MSDFQGVFIPAVLLAMLSRVVGDFTYSPKSLLLSGSFFAFQLGTLYQQAYLIRRLDLIVLFSALYFGRRLLQARTLPSAGFSTVVTTLSFAYLLVSVPRVLMVSAVIALILYGAFLSRPTRAKVFTVLVPLFILLSALLVPQVQSVVTSTLGQDPSFTARANSTQIALKVFAEYPIFGLGQDSLKSISYQQLFGPNFYPGDIGLLGVAFQYGLVGVLLYVILSAWLFANLLRLLWSYIGNASEARLREKVFVWVLFITCFAIILGSWVQARFIKPEGLSIAAFCLGLLVSRKHGLLDYPRKALQERSAPPQMSKSSAES